MFSRGGEWIQKQRWDEEATRITTVDSQAYVRPLVAA